MRSTAERNRTGAAVLAAALAMLLAGGACFAQSAQTQSATPLGNAEPGRKETAVGDLAADAVREALQCNVAFVAASELKPIETPLPAGTVTSSQIAELVSYPNDPLAVLLLNGRTIRQALEKAVSISPQRNLGFLQVSGLRFKYDPKQKPGNRVTSVVLDKTPLNDDYYYTVGVTNSMANGALGYWKIWRKDDIKTKFPDGSIVRSVENYFRAHAKIDYGKLDRITAE